MRGGLLKVAVDALERAARLRPGGSGEAAHIATGRRGEDEAYFFLRRRGYTVVARNWRSPRRRGEVDLIAWDGGVLCFVEVKTRSTREIKPAEAAVDHAKQKELAAMARLYLRRLPGPLPVCRADVVSVYNDSRPPDITLFKDAFRLR
jgi:putative endonuclease